MFGIRTHRDRAGSAAWVLLLAVSLGACRQESEPALEIHQAQVEIDDSAVVARVDGREITAQTLRREIVRSGLGSAWATLSESEREEVLDRVVQREILAISAERAGYDEDPDLVESHKRQLGETFWRAQLVGTHRLLEVSDEEVRAYYEAHAEEFRDPVRTRGAVIAFHLAPNASDDERKELREKAERVRKEALALPDDTRFFGDLAERYSTHPATARRGGDMGWIGDGARVYSFEPAVIEALSKLGSPGAVGPVVEGGRGLYLVKLVARQGGEPRPLSVVEAQIRNQLRGDKTRELRERLHAQLRQGFEVDVERDVLRDVGSRLALEAQAPRPPSFPLPAATEAPSKIQ